MKYLILLITLILSLCSGAWGQAIRGRVTDAQSLQPLPGAYVVVEGSEPLKGATTDEAGYFRIADLGAGRFTIRIGMTGYTDRTVRELQLLSGKDAQLEIQLEEKVTEKEEVVISAQSQKERYRPNNEAALISARSFDVEETRRYAGSRQDPARMASNYAGVSGANDGRNDIVIRGNSPTGLLWRLEGADVFNPNHFGALGATGGPVGMLNNNVLANSDFLTGAFPAGYGNALAGVFDLQIRPGNPDRHEFLGQIGFNGFEGGLEGPISRKNRSSYLVNYRYSTLALVSKLGVSFGTGAAVPYYQDLSFKVHVPTRRLGTFSVFGVGGKSHINFEGRDADSTNLYADPFNNIRYATKTGVAGVKHLYNFSQNTWGRLLAYASASGVDARNDSLNPDGRPIPYYRDGSRQLKRSLRYTVGHKASARISFTAGAFADLIGFTLSDSVFRNDSLHPYWKRLKDNQGDALLAQAFVQTLWHASPKLQVSAGLHGTRFSLAQGSGGSYALEPRLGARYALGARQELSLAAGVHSQVQPIAAYFVKTRLADGTYTETNRDLDLTRSLHLVGGHTIRLTESLRLKSEAYFQHLWNVPVERRSGYYSMLNEGADFNYPETDSLVNTGRGRNLGLELTLEQNFNKGKYLLFTGSLFDSRYQGSNGLWRNTAFNGNYILNALAGKEWKLGQKTALALDLKVTWAGGRRYTPVDVEKSRSLYETEYMVEQSFEKQLAAYFRADVKVTFRVNGKRVGQEWFLDVQNVTNRQNPYTQYWDARRGRLVTTYQLGLFPNFNYRINF